MEKILVTTDLSDESHAAFAVTQTLAKKFAAQVEILAIIENPAQAAMLYALDNPVLPSQEVQVQLKQKVESDLSKLAKTQFSDLNCNHHVVEAGGAVHTAIIRFAKENQVDLVVIATHGRTGLERLLIGSVAERVVRECPCPVLTVPSRNEG